MRPQLAWLLPLVLYLSPPLLSPARGDPQSRRTPIVEAVARSRDAIITLRVEKQGSFGRSAETLGTAIIVDEHGYAITNRHVVAYAAKVTACLADGATIPANVVHEDARSDLAILKLDGFPNVSPTSARKDASSAKGLFAALPLGPSCDLLVGETVIAIGNPFGYTSTVSRGIISALGREVTMPGGERIYDLIQIDAAINPGSSGGPLLNIHGELIGIVIAMREGAQGIAFAIPADAVKEFLRRHLNAKTVSGIDHGLTCTERVEEEGPARQQVVVAWLDRQGPAADAGIKPGDRILAVAGRAVANRFDVERAMWDLKPGAPIPLRIERFGKQLDLSLRAPVPAKSTVADGK